jgi:hypothetical protein
MPDITPEIVREAVRWNPAAWLGAYGKIQLKGGEIVRRQPNVYQERLNRVIVHCHQTGQPCRIVALKPRQRGSSTFSVAAAYRRMIAKRGRALIAGGSHFQGKNLFRMLKTYADTDELDPGVCKVMDVEARFSNGSTVERITLANSNAGRSGTYQVLIVTEVAYLAEDGVANADEVLAGLVKCVPYEPDTIVIEESTAKGASGAFYDRWQGGVEIADLEAGRSGYCRVFAAWWEFSDLRRDPASEGIRGAADYTAQEAELALRWKLDTEQVAWMRWAIRDECGHDFERFCQDYPFDAESAFRKSGSCRFGDEGLRYQESLVKVRPREFGVLEHNARADRVQWVACGEGQARCVRWESPRVGCRYLLSIDPMTGASQTGGSDPDSHGVFVIRAGDMYRGKWVEPAVVMRNMLVADGTRFGCWWDIDVLEEEVWRMARYWQAIIVPEMNMDRGLVELLKLRGDVDIYERELFNRREQVRTKALGWMTDQRTRGMVIENLARMVREAGRGVVGEGVEIRCPWALKQMRDFVVKASGRAEAAQGRHDDDVLALAIGCQLLDMATPWRESEREWDEPGGGGRTPSRPVVGAFR